MTVSFGQYHDILEGDGTLEDEKQTQIRLEKETLKAIAATDAVEVHHLDGSAASDNAWDKTGLVPSAMPLSPSLIEPSHILAHANPSMTSGQITPASEGSHSFAPMDISGVTWTGTDADETYSGGSLDDSLSGAGGSDVLNGYAGNDTLDGGDFPGTIDKMYGGVGNDTYYVHHSNDIVQDDSSPSGGYDIVITTVDFAIPQNIEMLEAAPGIGTPGTRGLQLTGSTSSEKIIGSAGDDTIDGMGSSGAGDSFQGGLGNDTYMVSTFNDQIVEAVGQGYDKVELRISTGYTLPAGAEIERVDVLPATGSGVSGNEFATYIVGGAGPDRLDGGVDDVVDTLEGRGGDDTYTILAPKDPGGATDIVIEKPFDDKGVANQGMNDTIKTQIDYTLAPGNAVEFLQALPTATKTSFALTGNEYTQQIYGSSTGNDTLDSGFLVQNVSSPIIRMYGDNGNDIFYVHRPALVFESSGPGTGSDIIYTDISFTILSGSAIETLQASAGFDNLTLVGNSFVNTIIGNDLKNTLSGGGGADTLSGGGGDDTYIVSDTLSQITEEVGGGTDTIQTSVSYALQSGLHAQIEVLQGTGTGNISLTGNDLQNQIIGNDGNNTLDGGVDAVADTLAGHKGNDVYHVHAGDVVVEADGEGTDTAIVFQSYTLADNVSIEVIQADKSDGTADFALTGNKFSNTITGADGKDTLDGGGGGDSLVGGSGDDTYHVHQASDVVVEGAGGGNDLIITDVSLTIAANVESLQAASGIEGITLTGNGASTLIGNEKDNTLIGGAGHDILQGGAGNDTYYVNDASTEIKEDAGGGLDTVHTSVSYTLSGTAEIEVLKGEGSAGLSLTGNALQNQILGTVSDDTLDGGGGGDVLTGGKGNDIYHVHAGDVVTEDVGGGNDLIITDVSFTASVNVETLQAVSGVDGITLTGNGASTLIGNEKDNTLIGLGGDLLQGGAGNDTYHVHAGDVVTELADGGSDLIVTDVSFTVSANVETLQAASGVEGITLTGNGASTLIGNEKDNTLIGGAGHDILQGGAGNDTYYVNDASTEISEDVGGGLDTIHTSFSYTLSGTAEIEVLQGEGSVGLDLKGNALQNQILGTVSDDTLDGGGGGDFLMGGQGNDTYHVHAGDTVIEASGEGTDTVYVYDSFTLSKDSSIEVIRADTSGGVSDFALTGNNLANSIYGADGKDTLDGGGHASDPADHLIGGGGDDTYYVHRADDVVTELADGGNDLIVTDVSLTISANVETLQAASGVEGITLTGNGASTLIGNEKDNTLIGNGGDLLQGGGGDDTYYVHSGDVVTEDVGGGNDRIITDVSFTASANVETLQAASGIEGITLTGNGASTLIGNEKDNTLIGLGGDHLKGGGGNDTYYVHAGDVVTELADGGNDLVVTDVSFTASANVESLQAASGIDGITLTGNGASTLIGNEKDNTLIGAGGDLLQGGAGNDTYHVHAGDTVVEAEGEGNDTAIVFQSYTLDDSVSIETLQANTGSVSNFALTGNKFANTIVAGAGDDSLDGGGGGDSLVGGSGDDTYHVHQTNDVVTELADGGSDRVITDVSFTASANVETLQAASGIEGITLTGNGASTLIGNEKDNTLIGLGGGGDFLMGGQGNDTYHVHAGDTVIEASGEGTDTVYVYDSFTLGKDSSIEVIRADTSGGVSDFALTGNNLANSIYGADGKDTLDGGGHASDPADHLIGGGGDDTYYVHRADDVVTELADGGNDLIVTDVSLTISANVETLQAASGVEGITLTGNGASTLIGNEKDNTLICGAGHDVLQGGAGDDVYHVSDASTEISESVGGGNDTVHTSVSYTLSGTAEIEKLQAEGSVGLDLKGNGFQNQILGNAGDDSLDGGGGGDVLTGGKGDDTYHVHAGDTVVEAAGEGHDTVYVYDSFTLGKDASIEVIRADMSGGVSDFSLTGNNLANDIYGADGKDTLDGGGAANDPADHLIGGAGDDTYHVHRADDMVTENAGGGNDLIITDVSLTIAANVETLQAADGFADIALTGNSESNTLIGNAGDNILRDGGGIDTMRGGDGDDIYYVSSQQGVVQDDGSGYDTVIITASIDYTLTEDSNIEELRAKTGIAVGKLTGNSHANLLIADAGDNTLDGGGGGDVLQAGIGNDTYYLHAGDKVVEKDGQGTDTAYVDGSYTLGNDVSIEILRADVSFDVSLTGSSFDNTIISGSGNDRLDGGGGADLLQGGLGNDTYIVHDTHSQIQENADAGFDTVLTSISFSLQGMDHVEALTAQAGAGSIQLIGNSENNIITGNEGDNLLDGGAGADTMAGAAGDDYYLVQSQDDTVVEGPDGGFDTIIVTTAISYTLAEGVYVEELRAGTGVNVLKLTGNSQENILIANEGDNSLDGGAGADILEGGKGNDTYYVDNVGDQVIESTANGTDPGGVDTVITTVSYTLGTHLENLTASGTADLRLTGNELSNVIIGNAGNNTLDGGGGNAADILQGGAGNDLYILHHASDQVQESANEGIDTVQVSFDYTLGANLEILQAVGSGGYVLNGNESDNTIIGGSGADTIDGHGGANLLQGGAGDDVYHVGANDTVVEAAGGGNDTVITDGSYTLGANIENLFTTSAAGVSLTGNELANHVVGGAGNDIIDGGAGADVLAGGAGNDTYYVDNPGDVVSDTSGFDTIIASSSYTLGEGSGVENLTAATGAFSLSLTGNSLNNAITGTAGNDTLDGGAGADVLTGGAGNDTYFIDSASDQIIDTSGVDTVITSVSKTLDAFLENLKASASAGGLRLIGNALNNEIVGGNGNDVIFGGPGSDTLTGGAGKDIFALNTKVARKHNANVAHITDFKVKEDAIDLENAVFKKLGKKGTEVKPGKLNADFFHIGAKAADQNDYIIYNKKNGNLYYDDDGSGSHAQIQIAVLQKNLALTKDSFHII